MGIPGLTKLLSEKAPSHLQGMFSRTVRILDAGIKPMREKKADADEKLAAAKEAGNAEDVEKYGKAGIRVTREQTEECKRLLRLMGVPVVEAPCEAEATCAALCAAGLVHSVGSEDMDTLTFGAPRLSRNLMKPANADAPVLEITLAAALAELGLSREQFVDVCILIGCDYLDPIKGCGPVSALKLITDHGSIEAALPGMRKNGKYTVPEVWPYQEARDLFLKPLVADVAALPEFKWTPPDEAGLLAFLVGEKTFAEERVRKSIDKVKAAKGKATQNRLESFFGAPTTVKSTLGVKRAAEKAEAGGKGGKGGPAKGGEKKKGKGVGGGGAAKPAKPAGGSAPAKKKADSKA